MPPTEVFDPHNYPRNFEISLGQWEDIHGLDLRAEMPQDIASIEALLKVSHDTRDCRFMKGQLAHKFAQYIDALARYRESGREIHKASVEVEEATWRSLLEYMSQTEPTQWDFSDYLDRRFRLAPSR